MLSLNQNVPHSAKLDNSSPFQDSGPFTSGPVCFSQGYMFLQTSQFVRGGSWMGTKLWVFIFHFKAFWAFYFLGLKNIIIPLMDSTGNLIEDRSIWRQINVNIPFQNFGKHHYTVVYPTHYTILCTPINFVSCHQTTRTWHPAIPMGSGWIHFDPSSSGWKNIQNIGTKRFKYTYKLAIEGWQMKNLWCVEEIKWNWGWGPKSAGTWQ